MIKHCTPYIAQITGKWLSDKLAKYDSNTLYIIAQDNTENIRLIGKRRGAIGYKKPKIKKQI